MTDAFVASGLPEAGYEYRLFSDAFSIKYFIFFSVFQWTWMIVGKEIEMHKVLFNLIQ